MFAPRKVADRYRDLISSIGFYPSLLSILFLVFAFVSISFEFNPYVVELKSLMQFMLLDTADNARTLLSILIGSTISLTVFSFSMVMIVLNQASSALSPRVIPGLITRKSHQLVLGVYLGSIIYATVMLINIKVSSSVQGDIPSLGILFALMFGLICLALFVYFIHSISKAIQVDNVLNELFQNTLTEIKALYTRQDRQASPDIPDFEQWFTLCSDKAGYFKGVDTKKLCTILKQHDLQLFIAVKQGYFTVEGYPFLKCNKDLSEQKELKNQILNCFVFYIEEFISDHYRYGLTQISEIAVKAMSPGINDPGTAVKAIDMLSILIIERLGLEDINFAYSDLSDTDPLLFIHETSLMELMHDNFTPIRHYAKADAYVMANVLEAFKNIIFVANKKSTQLNTIYTYLNSIIIDIDTHTDNPFDRQEIADMINAIKHINPDMAQQALTRFEVEKPRKNPSA